VKELAGFGEGRFLLLFRVEGLSDPLADAL
jgi:hypothetical protein